MERVGRTNSVMDALLARRMLINLPVSAKHWVANQLEVEKAAMARSCHLKLIKVPFKNDQSVLNAQNAAEYQEILAEMLAPCFSFVSKQILQSAIEELLKVLVALSSSTEFKASLFRGIMVVSTKAELAILGSASKTPCQLSLKGLITFRGVQKQNPIYNSLPLMVPECVEGNMLTVWGALELTAGNDPRNYYMGLTRPVFNEIDQAGRKLLYHWVRDFLMKLGTLFFELPCGSEKNAHDIVWWTQAVLDVITSFHLRRRLEEIKDFNGAKIKELLVELADTLEEVFKQRCNPVKHAICMVLRELVRDATEAQVGAIVIALIGSPLYTSATQMDDYAHCLFLAHLILEPRDLLLVIDDLEKTTGLPGLQEIGIDRFMKLWQTAERIKTEAFLKSSTSPRSAS